MNAPKWTPEQRAAVLALLDEMEAMSDIPSVEELEAEGRAWAEENPEEAEAFRERMRARIAAAIERRSKS